MNKIVFEGEGVVISTAPVLPIAMEPCMITSAFLFKNGIRFLVCTSGHEIKSFTCNEKWEPDPEKPFAHCPLHWSGKTATEYHLHLRQNVHRKEDFVPEQSTPIDWTHESKN